MKWKDNVSEKPVISNGTSNVLVITCNACRVEQSQGVTSQSVAVPAGVCMHLQAAN